MVTSSACKHRLLPRCSRHEFSDGALPCGRRGQLLRPGAYLARHLRRLPRSLPRPVHQTPEPPSVRHARSSPGIWQTFIQSAPQGTVAHHGAVATPVTLQSHVPTQVTLKHVSSLPVYFNSLANNQVLLQSPAQTPVTLKVAVPTSAGAAGFGPIVLKATSDSLKVGDPKVVQNLAPTPVSIAPIAPVIYKAETPDEDKDEDTQTVSFRTSVPATFQAVAPAPVTYSVAAPTPVNIEGAVPAPVVQAVTFGSCPSHCSSCCACSSHLCSCCTCSSYCSSCCPCPSHLCSCCTCSYYCSSCCPCPSHLCGCCTLLLLL
nr:uncharacterized protein LOC113829879 [Penaeus vannamei]